MKGWIVANNRAASPIERERCRKKSVSGRSETRDWPGHKDVPRSRNMTTGGGVARQSGHTAAIAWRSKVRYRGK